MSSDAGFSFDAHRVTRGLVSIVVVLQLLHLMTLVLRYGLGQPSLLGFVPMFDTDHEKNAPTYFSALNMLLCAQLLALVTAIERRRASPAWPGWALLTVIFVLLPFDELFELHEMIGRAVHSVWATTGIFGYAWVIPYGLVTIVCGALLLRLLAKAPPDTRRRVIAAGAVYVAGAIGLEMFGAWVLEQQGGEKTLPYALCTTVEELLEMAGIVMFTHALMLHLARFDVVLTVAASPQPAARVAMQAPITPTPLAK